MGAIFNDSEVSLNWTILNFAVCAHLPGEYISSPHAVLDSLGATLSFNLYPRGYKWSDQRMSLEVLQQNVDDVPLYAGKYVTLKILIPAGNILVNEKICYEKFFFLHEKKGCVKVYAISDLMPSEMVRRCISINVLKIDFDIKVQYDYDIKRKFERIDVHQLSSDIESGQANNKFSDLALKCSDGVELKVSKAILCARYPSFAEGHDLENDEIISLETNSIALNVLINYLYSGKIDRSSINDEMFEILSKYNIEHLQNTLFPVPKYLKATSEIQIQSGQFYWSIFNISSKIQNHKFRTFFTCNSHLNWTKLKFELHFTQNSEYEFWTLSIRRLYAEGKLSIRWQIIVRKHYLQTFYYIFEDGEEETVIDNFMKRKVSKDDIAFYNNFGMDFIILLSDGKIITTNYNISPPGVPTDYTNSIVENVWALQKDLRQLSLEQKFSDVTLDVQGHAFPAHKLILSARSPVFCKMFEHDTQENRTEKVVVEGFESRVVKKMLSYMYCGEMFRYDEDFDFASKVYAIAGKYELLRLKSMCCKFFEETLCVGNVGNLLVLADTHLDAELKISAQNFVASHYNEVLKSSNWTKLMSERSDLEKEMSSYTLKATTSKQ